MALSANTVWECRPSTGADTNGGGFVAGASGLDYSTQASPQYSVTDGVTAGSTTITSATAAFGTDVVGNIMYVQGGTGSVTAGWYQIVTRVDASTVTVDRSTGLTAGTGVTLHIGGALQTLAKLAALMVSSNKAFVKAESTITITATPTFTATGMTPSPTVPATHLIGYTTTRGDNGQVSITQSTNTGLYGLNPANAGWIIEGFNINCASLSGSYGIVLGGTLSAVRNCKISNFGSRGINATANNCTIHHCEITGGAPAGAAAIQSNGSGCSIYNNWLHDNQCPGLVCLSAINSIFGNVISNNSGASSDGISLGSSTASGDFVFGNVIYKNGRHGILLANLTFVTILNIRNNIITDHTAVGAAGLKSATAALPAEPRWDGNFYYNNTSNRVNMDDTSTNAVDGVNPYTNVFDVQLTASPFTAAASNDFTLNTTAGGGAAVRGHGLPGVGGTVYSGIPGLSQTGYLDGGVFQHQDSGGSAGMLFVPGMDGGAN